MISPQRVDGDDYDVGGRFIGGCHGVEGQTCHAERCQKEEDGHPHEYCHYSLRRRALNHRWLKGSRHCCGINDTQTSVSEMAVTMYLLFRDQIVVLSPGRVKSNGEAC